MAYRKLNAYSELRTKRENEVEAISDIGGTAGSSGVLFFFRSVARAPRLSNTMVRGVRNYNNIETRVKESFSKFEVMGRIETKNIVK